MSLINTLRRGVKRAYEEIVSNGRTGIEKVLYRVVDQSPSAAFMLDSVVRGEMQICGSRSNSDVLGYITEITILA